MVDINKIKEEIVDRLKPLGPDKIILFGSYAYGSPGEESDIDLFLLLDRPEKNIEAKAIFRLRDLMKKYRIGFDVVAAEKSVLANRQDPFYNVDIMKKGRLLYGK